MQLLLIYISILSFFSTNLNLQHPEMQDGFSVSGTIVGADGKRLYLYQNSDSLATTRSSFIKGGKFEFKGKLKGDPQFYILKIEGKPQYLELLLSNSTVKVEGQADYLNKAKISGAVDDSLHKVFTKVLFGKNYRELEKVSDRYLSPETAPDSLPMLRQLKLVLENEQNRIVSSFIQSHPKSYASTLALAMFLEYLPVKESEELLALIRKEGQSYAKVSEIEIRLDTIKELAIGKRAKDFSQLDTGDRLINLSSFKGKYVLLDFWASWCGPCIQENSYLVKIYDSYKHQNFTIISVSLDSKRAQWLKAIQRGSLSWTQLSDLKGWDNSVAKLYDINSVPANFLIDPEGKIIAKNLRGFEIAEKLQQVYK